MIKNIALSYNFVAFLTQDSVFKGSFCGLDFTDSNIVLYFLVTKVKIMSGIKTKSKTQKLSFKLAPYLFIAVAIFTAFSSNGGTWV